MDSASRGQAQFFLLPTGTPKPSVCSCTHPPARHGPNAKPRRPRGPPPGPGVSAAEPTVEESGGGCGRWVSSASPRSLRVL